MKLNYILACHNRARMTEQALRSVLADGGADARFIIYDDGSTDDTTERLLRIVPSATLLRGTGTEFWAASMARAEQVALANATDDEDYLVWLNDDVVLDNDAITRMKAVIRVNPGAVVVGAMRAPSTGDITYSGLLRNGLHPLNFRRAHPQAVVTSVDTLNGNFVFVPVPVALRIGGIDGLFAHALADIDYGLRCQAAEVPVLLAAGTFGVCARNPMPGPEGHLGAWKRFTGPKGGGNKSSMKRILKKTSPIAWPLFMTSTYVLWWARRLKFNLRVT